MNKYRIKIGMMYLEDLTIEDKWVDVRLTTYKNSAIIYTNIEEVLIRTNILKYMLDIEPTVETEVE